MRGSSPPRDLLRACEEVIKTYNPKRVTLETHVDEFLAAWKGRQHRHDESSLQAAAFAADSSFIREVFYGVMRYKGALKAFMTCFFNDMMARVVRSDYTTYMILTYLCIFRLEELTLEEFRRFAFAIGDPDKSILLLEYIFKIEEESEVFAHWVRILDADYVHDDILGGLANNREGAEELIAELEAKSNGIVLEKSSEDRRLDRSLNRKKATVPNAPNITKPNPRRVPEPIMIRNRRKRESSSETGDRPVTPCEGEEGREDVVERRVRSDKATTKANGPRLHQTQEEKRMTIEREMEEKVADAIDFDRRFRRKAPPAPTATVRLNTAAILREESLFRQQQEQEAKAMRDFEIELRDSSEFNRWQADMKSRDLQNRQDQVVRTRILARASAEDAAVAKANKLLDNRQLAEQVFEESSAMREQRRLESEMALVKNRHQAQEVRQVRETAPKKAVERVVQEKHEIRREVRDDLADRLAKKKREDEERTAQVAERVRRLKEEEAAKATESSPSFDPSSSAGLGLLDEMSMIEMQARLKVNKVRNLERCEKKRDEIANAKIAYRESIADKVETIRQVREFAALKHRQARQQQAAREAALKEHARKTEEELLLRLVDDAAAKRTEIQERRAQLALEEEQQAKKNMFLGNGVAVREKRNAAELLKAAERAASQNQKKAVEAALLYEATKKKERRQHDINKARVTQARHRSNTSRDKTIKEAREITTQAEKTEIAAKKRMYREERDRAQERLEKKKDLLV